MLFEPELAQLRYIRLGEKEVIRAVYAAVRDRNWGTVTPRIANLRIEVRDAAFAVGFDVSCRQGEIDFLWHGTIAGDERGTVKFDFDGTARSTFLRNRLGFCVLHPIDGCAGEPVTIGKAKGGEERGNFPADISPHQPFFEIRSIRHAVAPGLEADVQFAGEVFEMEDHRNWTDASFKTYCTPLGLPFPVEVKQGTRVQQGVTLRLIGSTPRTAAVQPAREVTLDVQPQRVLPLPQIGLGLPEAGPALTPNEVRRLRPLQLSHLRVDLDLGSAAWNERLTRAAGDAQALGAALEIALKLGSSPEAELKSFAAAVAAQKPKVARYLVFHKDEKSTSGKWMEAARAALRATNPGAKLSSGTDAYFTELNRERPPVAQSDAVCYSVNPQVHAFDNASLVETLAMQAATLESARKFCGSLPIAVTPVTLKPRGNPNATAATAPASANTLPEQVDPRQMSQFGAAWTLGSLKYLAEGGAAAATYYETVGWRGVMESERGCAMPDEFRSRPGEVFPVYHVLADLGEFSGGQAVVTRSADPLRVDGLLLRKGGRGRLLLANLSPELQQVRVRANLGRSVRVRMLDEHSAEAAMRSPEAFRSAAGELRELSSGGVFVISLLPYAVARVDYSM
jgi:hypothetical protein